MGIQHNVDVTLKANFNEKNVFKILKNGSDIGFVYSEFNYSDDIFKVLSLQDATIRILIPCDESFKSFGRILVVRHYDVFFHMFFTKLNNNQLLLTIGGFGYNWKTTFFASGSEQHDVKYQRFIKTALDLCKDFCLEEIKTEAS